MAETSTSPVIHRCISTEAAVPVNAYLIEMEQALVAIDGTLTVAGGRSVRARARELGKPLIAVLVTHAHPDHYGGVVELVGSEDIPVVATSGVAEIIRRDDAVKERILRPMIGDQWPAQRLFPTITVEDAASLELGDARFTVVDLGPGESPHDSMWLLGDDRKTVFCGDQAYGHMHGYLADGFYEHWLTNISRMRAELPPDATLYLGHGEPDDPSILDWQAGYIETFRDAIRAVDVSESEAAQGAVVRAMRRYCDDAALQFLMELSIEPMLAKLGGSSARSVA